MKFGAKYETLKALTRGDVEVFAVRKRTSGEELLAYIFECPEAPQDQPTAQWILSNFARMAPDAPGDAQDVGKYDVANFAYVIMSMPAPEGLDQCGHEYQKKADLPPPSSPSGPEVVAATAPPAEQPSSAEPIVGDAAHKRLSRIGSALPEDRSSSKPAAEQNDSQGETLLEGFGSQPRKPGEFTRQFFREVASGPDDACIDAGVTSTGPWGQRPASAASSEASPKGTDTSPDFGVPSPQAPMAKNAPPIDDSIHSKSGGISSGEFARFFQMPSETREADDGGEERSPIGPRMETGEFTRIFGSDIPGAAVGPEVQGPIVDRPSTSPHGSSTDILNNFAARGASPTTETGEFTKLFRSDGPRPADDSRLQAPAFDRSATSIPGSSTDIFNRDTSVREAKPDVGYSFEANTPGHEIADGSSTVVFGEPSAFSGRTATGEHFTSPGVSPSSSSGVIRELRDFEAADGSATVAFGPMSERAVEADDSAGGHSPYSVFMSREALNASMPPADQTSTPSTSTAGGGAAAAAAFASPFFTPPAIPSYQPSSPQIPAYPGAPAMPAGSVPGAPAFTPPAVAVPPLSAPGGQPAPAPKSYWPLILTLTVLFFLAVLLVVYFALKH